MLKLNDVGYFGKPTISSCGENGEPYTLEGCNFKTRCSIPDTTGYIIDIKIIV